MILNEIRLNARAPTITNMRDGSQLSFRVKNPIILDTFVIPDIMSPRPKIRPTRKESAL